MEDLIIQGKKDVYFIPNVNLQAKTGKCLISGESYLEETVDFYQPILDWLERYVDEIQGDISFDFRLTYFNTSSSRCIVDILHLLKDYEEDGGLITINWYFNRNEIDQEDIEDFIEETGVDINLIHTSDPLNYNK